MPQSSGLIIIIPCYNHGSTLCATVRGLAPLNLPIVVVDDGCNETDKVLIAQCQAEFADICTVLTHEHNQGKGMALKTGLAYAHEHGFTSALQIDADGQHDQSALPALLAEAEAYPDCLISGLPQYDDTMPTGRRIGRWITHVWVWIETLSLEIKDSMCGFRVYPVAKSLEVSQKCGQGMDFDTEIMVRLFWAGIKTRFVPVKVIYPEGGYSNFKAFADNVKISWMHTKLVTQMLLSLPVRLCRRLFKGGRA